MKQIKLANVTVITKDEFHAMLEEEGRSKREYIEWVCRCEADDGCLYSEWLDTRSGKAFVVRETRTVHFGLNDIPEDKVQEFVGLVERDGMAAASWSCDGRTRHHMLACQLASLLPQYRFEIDRNYKCEAYKD